MSCSDKIADLLSGLKNGQVAMLKRVKLPFSRINMSLLKIFQEEGFIVDFVEREVRKGVKEIEVVLKYHLGLPVIRSINRVSKPGRRVYCSAEEMPKFYNGLGIYVISTSKGLVIDHKARRSCVGGEILCSVF